MYHQTDKWESHIFNNNFRDDTDNYDGHNGYATEKIKIMWNLKSSYFCCIF